MKKVYIVKFWEEGIEERITDDDMLPNPVIFKVVDSEEKAKVLVEEAPLMFYDEYEVE